MAEAPRPISDGVLGMARITAVPSGRAASIVARRTPAAIDSTRATPASASDAHTAVTCCGFTATTAASAATGASRTVTPAGGAAARLRGGARRLGGHRCVEAGDAGEGVGELATTSGVALDDSDGAGVAASGQEAPHEGLAHPSATDHEQFDHRPKLPETGS